MTIEQITYAIAFLGLVSFLSTIYFDLIKFFGVWSMIKLWVLRTYKNKIGCTKEVSSKYPPRYYGLIFLDEKDVLTGNEKSYFEEWLLLAARFFIFISYMLVVGILYLVLIDITQLNIFRFLGISNVYGIPITALLVAFGSPYLKDFLSHYRGVKESKEKSEQRK